CQDAERALDAVLHFADGGTELVLRRLAAKVPVENPRGAFVVFNPWPWQVTLPLEFEYTHGEPEARSAFVGADGRPLTVQYVQRSDLAPSGRARWVVVDTLPALGYKRYEWNEQVSAAARAAPLEVSATAMENRWLRLEIDPETGEWTRLLHRASGHGILAARGCCPVVLRDESDTWSHSLDEYTGTLLRFGRAELRVEEQGPVRGVVRAERKLGCSRVVFRTMVYAELPYVFLELDVNWQEPRSILQLHFPILVTGPRVVAEQAYGCISRVPDGGEESCQQWIDVYGEAEGGNGALGLLIVNDGLWSYSMKDGVLRLTLLRSPIYAHHDPSRPDAHRDYHFVDLGFHRFRFLFLPHLGDWRAADPYRLALAFNEPPRSVVMPLTRGDWAPVGSFCRVEPENVVAVVLKKAFDDDCLVLRCFETHGRPAQARVHFPHERAEGSFAIGPYELKTLVIRERAGQLEFQEISALEWELVKP
ncbi:MAG: hypothetical protein ONB23_10265, partial [candidate division KSB1 bacterium]|nr:hypothetical protein [candidate division KSB1 bacterium]